MYSTEENVEINFLILQIAVVGMLADIVRSLAVLYHIWVFYLNVKCSLQPCYYPISNKKDPNHLLEYLIIFIVIVLFFALCCVDPNWLKSSSMRADI